MNRLNLMRYGDLDRVLAEMDGDEPLSDDELRALVFNLADKLQRAERDILRITEPVR